MTNPSTAVAQHGDLATHPAASVVDSPERVRVWDPFVRFFHWSLAVAVLIAFVTGDELEGLHVFVGYVVMGLIAARLVWGVIGPKHARWWDFVRGPRAIKAYLGDVLRGHPARYLGHSPAGGAMAVALIAGLVLTTLSGLAAQSVHGLKEVHELIAYATLCLVPSHLLGVAVASFQHKENLVRGMIDGYKRK
ncbi:cytochrome b/b6 domain-containing protein [Thiocapsa bogorovii]|uniref:cytochrome b/b6 domain-containing protein n=1 Tax=Thiocapsa bogorovii TaxID=521689 RepID=UPI001E60900E|nr:cytochrome b/b6 domain-containing protein [Thiocapsa bogorovii]UHD16497.1 cytochrome b/b6 domain-containing protein [Thiocapsa bogorovii]